MGLAPGAGPSCSRSRSLFLFIGPRADWGSEPCLAALNVKYRDFRYVIPFLVQFWMFATPTVYMQPPGRRGLS